jgi:hypothetical protein
MKAGQDEMQDNTEGNHRQRGMMEVYQEVKANHKKMEAITKTDHELMTAEIMAGQEKMEA